MAQVQQVPRPVRVAFDVAEHDRRRGRQAGAMRLRDDAQPWLRAELVGCELVADLVIEEFCGSARQRAEAGARQFTEIFRNRKTECLWAQTDFQRGESMQDNLWQQEVDGARTIGTKRAGERRRE